MSWELYEHVLRSRSMREVASNAPIPFAAKRYCLALFCSASSFTNRQYVEGPITSYDPVCIGWRQRSVGSVGLGRSGRPVVLLAGGGDTAHVFDDFAPKLTAHDHVYGITRRGFGASGYAEAGDVAERLGEDVLAVIDALQLNNPILVGHSIAGGELSWMANTHPNRIAGPVYLEAGYSYAFDNGKGSATMEMMKLQAPQPPPPNAVDLVSFNALQKYDDRVNGFQFPEAELREERQSKADGSVGNWCNPPGGPMLMKLITGGPKYTKILVTALFIFANPHSLGPWVDSSPDASVRTAAKAYTTALTILTQKQEMVVEHGVPTARVITLHDANHYVFLSNQTDVLRYLSAFLTELQP